MITKAGVYDLDIDLYHSQKCCAGPSVSSSALRKVLLECPARFYAYSDINPDPYEKETSKAFGFGKAAHALMLGEPRFETFFFVSPHEVFNKNPGKAWHDDWKAQVEAGNETRQLVRPSEMKIVERMVKAQRADPEVLNAFVEGAPEKSIIWQDEETGVFLKARPDWLPHKPAERLTTEYKTTVTCQPRKLSAAVFQYGYEMQAALCLDAIETVMGVTPKGMAHIVQEKDAPYLVELKLFTPEQINFGRLKYRKAVRIFADCLHTGKWPGWTKGPSYYDTPYYIAQAMENFDDGLDGEEHFSGADYLAAG